MSFNFTFYKEFTLWAEKQFIARAKAAEGDPEKWAEVATFARECFSAVRELFRPFETIAKLLKGGRGFLDQLKTGAGIIAFVTTHADPFANGRQAIRGLYEKYGNAPASYRPNVAGFGSL